MFEYELDLSLEATLGVLEIEKVLFDHGKSVLNLELDQDAYYEAFWEASWYISETVESKYLEEFGTNLITFSDPLIDDYYALCNEYGKRCHVRFRQNQYVTKAEQEVMSILYSINSYEYAYDLQVTPKKGRKSLLFFEYSDNFYEFDDAIGKLLDVIEFYRNGVEELKEELEITVQKEVPDAA